MINAHVLPICLILAWYVYQGGGTALIASSRNGYTEIINALLAAGAVLNINDNVSRYTCEIMRVAVFW